MTKREAAIVATYTGILIGDIYDMKCYMSEIMGGIDIYTHMLADEDFVKAVKEKAKPDFLAIKVV